jgi:hypothetical protein
MENVDLTEQWRSMQRMFLPTPAISASLIENARSFWETQDKLLNNMQAVANAWFNRRHVGTEAAREAAERMCTTYTFVDFGQAYQHWARGAFERVIEDCQQQITAASSALASPPLTPSVAEKETEPARSETRAAARSKATYQS